jgi:hypothetical protein
MEILLLHALCLVWAVCCSCIITYIAKLRIIRDAFFQKTNTRFNWSFLFLIVHTQGVPQYILPEKKNHYGNAYENNTQAPSTFQEKRYMSRYLNSHLNSSSSNKRMGIIWSKGITGGGGRSQSEGDNDSSSGEETPGGASSSGPTSKSSSDKLLARRLHSDSVTRKSTRSHNDSISSNTSGTSLKTPSNHRVGEEHLLLIQKSFDRFDPSGSLDQAAFNDNNARSSESSSTNDCAVLSSASATTATTSTSQASPSSSSVLHSPHGTIEVSLLYDISHEALHCTVHKAKVLFRKSIYV